jgi:hypothetical protein
VFIPPVRRRRGGRDVPAVRAIAAIAAAVAIASSRLFRGPRPRGGGLVNPLSTAPAWLLPTLGAVGVLLIGLLVLRKLTRESEDESRPPDDDGSREDGDAIGPDRRRLLVLGAVVVALGLGVAAFSLTRAPRAATSTTISPPLPKD